MKAANDTDAENVDFPHDSVSSDQENAVDEPHGDFFGVKQYAKKRSLSNGDAFLPKEALADEQKKSDSDPKGSDTTSNTDNAKRDEMPVLTKMQSQPTQDTIVSQQANMTAKPDPEDEMRFNRQIFAQSVLDPVHD